MDPEGSSPCSQETAICPICRARSIQSPILFIENPCLYHLSIFACAFQVVRFTHEHSGPILFSKHFDAGTLTRIPDNWHDRFIVMRFCIKSFVATAARTVWREVPPARYKTPYSRTGGKEEKEQRIRAPSRFEKRKRSKQLLPKV